ncbi:MAG: glycosyltransferase family 2 protein [Candidatus Microthrix sp.]|nr:glycosyltransferase family 2 protein [Candidatus Microthrix sp.]
MLLLNSDTVVLPTTVEPLVRFLDEHPRAGTAGARHLNADGSLQRSMDDVPTLLPDALYYTELYRVPAIRRWLSQRCAWWSDHDVEREAGWVNGACMMVRRDVITEIGGLDERLFIYGEELDWCYRMKEVGWTVHFVPTAEVIHLGGQAMDSAADRRAQLLMKRANCTSTGNTAPPNGRRLHRNLGDHRRRAPGGDPPRLGCGGRVSPSLR